MWVISNGAVQHPDCQFRIVAGLPKIGSAAFEIPTGWLNTRPGARLDDSRWRRKLRMPCI